MRNIVLLFTALVLGTSGIVASTIDNKVATRNAYRYNNSFIFVENGITFSVFSDGEFDFHISDRASFGANFNFGRTNITFNSGYDYNPYAQYDDYGAVIQVENVPIYYDHYGRVTQIGDVNIAYRNGRVFRMGSMYVYYNHNGYYDYHTGYINIYNRHYVYRPFHRFFSRPTLGSCLVFNRPYRRYYAPYRYTYYSPYRYNHRKSYAKIGRDHRYNRVRRERASVYRNDKRVAVRENRTRGNRSVAKRNNTVRTKRSTARRGDIAQNNRNVRRSTTTRSNRSNGKLGNRTVIDRTKRIENRGVARRTAPSIKGRTGTKRSTMVRSPKRNVVTKRTVTQTPRNRTVTRSTKTYRKPQIHTGNRSVAGKTTSRSKRSVSTQSTTPRRSVSKAPSRSRNNTVRSSSSRRTVGKAPQRSSRTNSSKATQIRSSRRN